MSVEGNNDDKQEQPAIDPQQMALDLPSNTQSALDSKRKENNSFRQLRDFLMIPNLFVLSPEKPKEISNVDGVIQTETRLLTSSKWINQEKVTLQHPPMGVDEQRLLHALIQIAQGDIRGTKWVYKSNDTSPAGQSAFSTLGSEAKLFGDSVMVLSPSRRQLVEASRPYLSSKNVGKRDVDSLLVSLDRLSQIRITVVSKRPDGRDIVKSASLISSFVVDDKALEITLNPRMMNAVIGLGGTYTVLAIDEFERIRGNATHLLWSYFNGNVDRGEGRTFPEEKVEEIIYGDVLAGIPENKEKIKHRRRIIKDAMGELADIVGWTCEYIKPLKSSAPSWRVFREDRGKKIPNLLDSKAGLPSSNDSTSPLAKPSRRGSYRSKKTP